MRSRRFRFLSIALVVLVAGACADDTPVRAYEARGVVTGIPESRDNVVLSHDAIANYMPAMAMPFPLAHPDILEGFRVGDEVVFQIVVSASGAPTLVDMRKVSTYSGPFPEFELSTLDGATVDSSMLEGKVAIINFWASWCAPCREEMPMLVDLHHEYRDAGFVVVGITEDPENFEEIASQIEEFGIPYPIVLGDGKLEDALGGVFSIPTTFVLDRRGNVAYKHVGLVSGDHLRHVIDGLL